MGTIRGTHKTGTNSARILDLLNKRLLQRPLPGHFCAALYAVLDPLTGALMFSNAGLPLPLLVSKAGCSVLGEGGLPSGLFPTAAYDQHVVQLSPGDAVLFATDGLHEAENRKGKDFSIHIQTAWAECWARPAAESLDFVFGRLEAFLDGECLRDDVTAVALTVPHPQR